MDKVTVSADALRQVLLALNGPGHYIRELQVTRAREGRESLFPDNPIDILVREYKEAARTDGGTQGNPQDTERFVWWFSDTDKPNEFINTYLQGVREHWSVDQWRACIDLAMSLPAKEGK